MLGIGALGHAGQILLKEFSNPTDVLKSVKTETIKPLREKLVKIIQELLGSNASEQQVLFCTISIFHQCIGLTFRGGKLPSPLDSMKQKDFINSFAKHIFNFSLAGIQKIKNEIN